jgi:hypothetical protein
MPQSSSCFAPSIINCQAVDAGHKRLNCCTSLGAQKVPDPSCRFLRKLKV